MKNLRIVLLSCALLTISSQTPFFLSAMTPDVIYEKSRSIITKAENIIPSLIEKDLSTKKKGSMDLLRLFEKPNVTNLLGLTSEPKLKFVQTLASLIDANNIILKVLSIGDIDPAVIVRLVEYIKIGMPNKLHDFVSKALVMAALFYQPQVIKVLLNYNPNLDFVYANKKAYQALLARREFYANENHLFKEILLQLMT